LVRLQLSRSALLVGSSAHSLPPVIVAAISQVCTLLFAKLVAIFAASKDTMNMLATTSQEKQLDRVLRRSKLRHDI
jgi:hypothetical protein